MQQPTSSKHWNARLDISLEKGPDRTIVRRNHTGPLAIQRPYYPEGMPAHVYLLHPPGGVVAHDNLQINVSCEAGSHGLVSTPGATKFYRSDSGLARAFQSIKCNRGSLEWFPQENIFFNGCLAQLQTRLNLSGASSLAWWEINCFGRPQGKAPFETGSVENTMELTIDSNLVLRDRLVVNEDHPVSTSCGLRGNNVVGTLLLTPLHAEAIESARSILMDKDAFSATTFNSVLIIRYLGDSSEEAKSGFIKVWSGLRRSLNGTTAMMPRIWAT